MVSILGGGDRAFSFGVGVLVIHSGRESCTNTAAYKMGGFMEANEEGGDSMRSAKGLGFFFCGTATKVLGKV